MQETMQGVASWAVDTFGKYPSLYRVIGRANLELAEAIREITVDPSSDKAAVECADVIIVLCPPAAALGIEWGAFEVTKEWVPPDFTTTGQYINHANRFMAQLLVGLEVAGDDYPDTVDLVNKIYVTLQYAIRRYGLEPADVIFGKMVVNRGRTWIKNGDGTGRHTRRGPNAGDQVGTFMGMGVFLEKDTSGYVRDKLLERLSAPDKVTLPCTGACFSRGCNCVREGTPKTGGETLVTDAVSPDANWRPGTGKITMADTLGADHADKVRGNVGV